MHNHKDVLVWEYAPERKLAQFVVNLRNVKGALAICSQAIAQYNINLLSGFHSAPSAAKVATWSFFSDVTESSMAPDEIAERLRSLPFVEGVEVYTSRDGLLFDDKNFPLMVSGSRAVLLTTMALNEMLCRLWKVFGTGAVTIIDAMGDSMGRFRARKFIEELGDEFVTANLPQLLRIYTAIGFAEMEIESFDQARGALSIVASGLFECCEGRAAESVGHSVFFRGHLRGFVSEAFNAPFDVTEKSCVSNGASECRFVASRVVARSPPNGSRERKDQSLKEDWQDAPALTL